MADGPGNDRAAHAAELHSKESTEAEEAGQDGLTSQVEHLKQVRRWAVEALEHVLSHQGQLSASVSRIVTAPDTPASFAVRIGDDHEASWSVKERRRRTGVEWVLVFSMRPRTTLPWTGYPRPRLPSRWSRDSVENAIQTLIANYERRQAWNERVARASKRPGTAERNNQA